MKILILGGTGAMGVHLTKLLSDNGIEVVVSTRQHRNGYDNVTYVQGNAHNLEFLDSILKQRWDAIVDFMIYTTTGFQNRIQKLLSATNQYVFISSARVYADSKLPITENTPRLLDVSVDKEYMATDEYALTKARQEDILKATGANNWTIIRPYITYSENRLQLGALEKEEWLYRALQGKTIVLSQDIDAKQTTLTYGSDVSKGIQAIIGNKLALGKAFHITNNESCSWNHVLGIYLDVLESHLGYRPRVILQDLTCFLKHKSARYQVIYDRLFHRKFDCSNIYQHMDCENFTPVKDGLRKCVESFLLKQHFAYIDWRAEALKDKYTNEHSSINRIPQIKNKVKYLFFRYMF